MRGRRTRIRGGLAVLLLVLAGCGLGPQAAPVPVPPLSPSAPPAATGAPDRTVSIVFLVRDARLVPVARPARSGLQGTLDLLSAGPGPRDTQLGLESYLTAQPLVGSSDPDRPGLAVVGITDAFTALPEEQRVLAAAQLVWTVTHRSGVDRVRAQTDGRPVPLPTSSGPQDRPVSRDDYLPQAPAPP